MPEGSKVRVVAVFVEHELLAEGVVEAIRTKFFNVLILDLMSDSNAEKLTGVDRAFFTSMSSEHAHFLMNEISGLN